MIFKFRNLKNKILKSYKLIIYLLKNRINLDTLDIDIVSLNELFNHFESDKGTGVIDPYSKSNKVYNQNIIGHGYGEFYEKHLKSIKNENIKILEIGTWKGASVAAFYFYFNKAKIYCLDRNFKLRYKSSRLKFFNCNTTNIIELKNLDRSLFKNEENCLDIIIDDGSHIYSDILRNFNFFFKKVKSGGYYIIEDFNHYKYYPELNDSNNSSLEIEDIFKHIVNKKRFKSNISNEDYQKYFFDNVSEIIINKGIQKDSYIAFIKKN